MINIAQSILNDIAKTQILKYGIIRRQFEASYEEASQLEDDFVREWTKIMVSREVETDQPEWRLALIVYELLPLVAENKSIAKFIHEEGIEYLKNPIPLIQHLDAAKVWVKKEMPFLSPKDRDVIHLLLKENLDAICAEVMIG